ncbi:hypothetical protein BJF83_00815 [Nocardiopsis sp. CNR-923]|uniref:nSTAND1 domain-containing NTPase n=1 Tax=Nocardiopsis sp. CNR-923 TaxID=1904965 RepID=UPI000964C8CC|nr:hypothetical protein [Nocardiopsis sp. CNR-923]OLT29181.1 hypothetical protein BJF83_00815 [Nocardiopsis sp. CNR-923]
MRNLYTVRALAADQTQADASTRRVRSDGGELLTLLRAIRRESGGPRRTVLVVDQLEELVTLSGDRDVFLDALHGDRHLGVVATLRVEFLGDLLGGKVHG